jgi:hypothetical protein
MTSPVTIVICWKSILLIRKVVSDVIYIPIDNDNVWYPNGRARYNYHIGAVE